MRTDLCRSNNGFQVDNDMVHPHLFILMKYLETFNLICVSQKLVSRLTMTWYDPFMRWNESEHNNINVRHLHFHIVFFFTFWHCHVFLQIPQNIRISPDRLWKPDILLYNSASADFYGAYQRWLLICRRKKGKVSFFGFKSVGKRRGKWEFLLCWCFFPLCFCFHVLNKCENRNQFDDKRGSYSYFYSYSYS